MNEEAERRRGRSSEHYLRMISTYYENYPSTTLDQYAYILHEAEKDYKNFQCKIEQLLSLNTGCIIGFRNV